MAAWLARRKLIQLTLLSGQATQKYVNRSFSSNDNPINSVSLEKSRYNAIIDQAKERTDKENQARFAAAIEHYYSREKFRRGHMEFIRLALARMDEFGLQKDLSTYACIIDIFPRGYFNPKNFLEAYWPRNHPQIDLALEILQKMEDNIIVPDEVVLQLLIDIFGSSSFPVDKCMALRYWFKRFKNIDPYKIVGEFPTSAIEISRLALQRISGDKYTSWDIEVPEKEDARFILGASSEKQIHMLESLPCQSEESQVIYIEGPHRLWLQKTPIFYYSMRLSEELEDGSVLSVCMCRPPTQDMLSQWFEHLQELYPPLKAATVVYNVTVLDDLFHWTEEGEHFPQPTSIRLENRQ